MVVFANFVSVIFDYFSGSFLAAKVRVKFQVYIQVYIRVYMPSKFAFKLNYNLAV